MGEWVESCSPKRQRLGASADVWELEGGGFRCQYREVIITKNLTGLGVHRTSFTLQAASGLGFQGSQGPKGEVKEGEVKEGGV